MASSISNPYDQLMEQFLEASAEGDTIKLIKILRGMPDVILRNNGGWTGLMFAARNGHVEAVKLLLEKGCDPNLINSSGQTASDIARFWNNQEIVQILEPSKLKANINQLTNYFGHYYLNRSGHRRKDAPWLSEQMKSRQSKFILFSNLDPVVVPLPDFQTKKSKQKFHLLTVGTNDISSFIESTSSLCILLGVDETDKEQPITWFAVDVSMLTDFTQFHAQAETISMYQLTMLTEKESSIVGQARSVLAWHDRYQFCPSCGGKTKVEEAGYKRSCYDDNCRSNKGVHNTSYPRVDPTAIMAVISKDRNRLLLGRGSKFPRNMWSCLAGFIEPGETIEDACRREVMEEAGVTVGYVEYHSCQPWPMPSSLMIGCLAFATEEQIKVDKDELEDARWFSRNDVLMMLNHQHPQGYFVPPEQAIAHQLIRAWISLTSQL